MGLSTAIMHKQDISKKHYSSLFWLNVFTGILLTILLVLSAPLIANFYDDQILVPIIQLLSLNIFFSSLGRQNRTIRHKQLNFKFMSNVENTTAILTLLLVVILAMNGFGVYSLVYSTMFEIIFSNLIYLIYGVYHDKNISFHFNFSETKSYLKIGVYQLGSSILDYFSREIDIFLISTAFGKETLGAYSLCKRIVQMLYGVITPILLKVATPMMATLQKSKNEMSRTFIKMLEIVSLVNFPIFTLVALLSPLILRIVYGEAYVEYSLILSFLAGVYAISAAAGAISSVQIALGRTDVGLYWTIFRIISTCIVLYIGSLFSPIVMVVLLFISTIISLFPFWRIQVKVMLNLPFLEYIKPLVYPFVSSIVIFLVLFKFINEEYYILSTLIFSVLFSLIYILGIYIFKRKYIPFQFKRK